MKTKDSVWQVVKLQLPPKWGIENVIDMQADEARMAVWGPGIRLDLWRGSLGFWYAKLTVLVGVRAGRNGLDEESREFRSSRRETADAAAKAVEEMAVDSGCVSGRDAATPEEGTTRRAPRIAKGEEQGR
jgi:hypothetical protein